MRIIITLDDDDLTVGACIEGVTRPGPLQAVALHDIAGRADAWRKALNTPAECEA